MGKIRILPDQVINQIAAGEVVDRPASVVKELVENALDAGATQIAVSVKGGGQDLIAVLDNGWGMPPDDARLSIARHATSKLRDADGLVRIRTLGFRGEALASIAAVSRFELVTCADETAGGFRLTAAGGGEPEAGRIGFPRGTRVTVADLFFNTPARRKFLRAAATEFQHIQSHVTQAALAHPAVQFRLTHGQRQVFHLPACKTMGERVRQLFGSDVADGLVEVAGSEGTVGYEGLISSPSHSQASRRWQYLFINGRCIRNPALNHGVYQAYRTLLMKERHPAYFLRLSLAPEDVDVNVHPAKTEVRLRNTQVVHTVLADRLHRELMDASRRRAFGTVGRAPFAAAGAERPAPALAEARPFAGGEAPGATPWGAPPVALAPPQQELPMEAGSFAAAVPTWPEGAAARPNPYSGDAFHFQPVAGVDPAVLANLPGLGDGVSVLTQFQATYILAQKGDELLVVDQHAAHERILFEDYRRQFYERTLVTEQYLVPLTLELSAQNALLLEQYLPHWARMGFAIEPFGRYTYLVREVPALLKGRDVPALILEVLDELALFGKSGRLEEVINEILERVACHAAIRAGMALGREEMEALVGQLQQLDINLYCPHGRPVWVEIPLRELEKRFKRIV